MRPIQRRLGSTLALFGGLAAAAIVLGPLAGSTSISLGNVVDRSMPFEQNVDAQIFFVARLPRTLAGAMVGAGATAPSTKAFVAVPHATESASTPDGSRRPTPPPAEASEVAKDRSAGCAPA